MLVFFSVIAAFLAGFAAAKKCLNVTVPVTISARTAIFNIALPQTNLDATAFSLNLTRQGSNFSENGLVGYQTTSGTYEISTQFCAPSTSNLTKPTVQVLTHGIGFDKTYWDSPYNDFNYSYVDVATDQYKYCTLSFDRLGIGNSSHGDPLNEIQASLEVAALAQLTLMLRNGSFPGINQTFSKVTHVGHSFGSGQTYALVSMYPGISDGIVLTGFSMNGSFMSSFVSGADYVQANLNQPFRLGNLSYTAAESVLNMYGPSDFVAGVAPTGGPSYVTGYLANSNANALLYQFLLPDFFDPGILLFAELTKQPVAPGELLTIAGLPMVNSYGGPVLVITGSNDVPFCGGDCLATGNPSLPSIPAAVAMSFPNVPPGNFTAYIQPHTGHGINFHYNATGAYNVILNFLDSKSLGST